MIVEIDMEDKIIDAERVLISIIIPVFNEENNVRLAYESVTEVFCTIEDKYQYEIIFTDNHSTDNTFNELQKIAKQDGRVRVVRYNRNYGFNKSLLTGYRLAKGACAIQLDCDLQDPPSLFPEFLRHWSKGSDVVVGLRKKREEGVVLQNMRKAFYRLLNRISEDNLVVDAGDFRLVDRSILDQLRDLYDANPYVRGLISSLATNIKGIPYNREIRLYDKSKFPFFKLVGLGISGIINHSTLPLRLASITGFIIAFLTLFMAGVYLVGRLIFELDWPSGFATQIIVTLFGISLNAIFLGIIGEYLRKIYQQSHQRPITIIEKSINMTLNEK
jgi:glycosyltransferase involved in cell wall biosynthesis